MKKMIFVFIVSAFSVAGFAQGLNPLASVDSHAEKFTSWVDKEVKLSDAQKTKVKAIALKYAKMRKTEKATAATKVEFEKDKINIETKRDAELKGVLSADQWAKYSAAKDKMPDVIGKLKGVE